MKCERGSVKITTSGFEESFAKILRAQGRLRPETRGRKPRKLELGDTRAGRTEAVGFVEPDRVEVPEEFLEPQPVLARSRLDGPTPESSRTTKRRGLRASDLEWVKITEAKDAKR